MGFLSKLFGENKNLEEIRSLMKDEGALLPSFPSAKRMPRRLFKVGEFDIALLVNAEPLIDERFGNAVVPVALLALQGGGSKICSYTVQSVLPNKPPYLVVWQPNGQYRIVNDRFKEPVNPDSFLQAYFVKLLKELGFSESVEVIEMTPRSL